VAAAVVVEGVVRDGVRAVTAARAPEGSVCSHCVAIYRNASRHDVKDAAVDARGGGRDAHFRGRYTSPAMASALIRAALSSYRDRLERALPGRVHRVVLFGSHARGEATEDSDVDVLVVLDRATHAERARAIDEGGMLGLELLLPVAPLVLTQAEWDELVARERLLVAEITRDGIAA